MQLTIYRERGAFDELRREWDSLLQRSVTNVLFLTWEWQSTWWEAYDAGDLWLVTCRTDSGDLIAIAPWFIENRKDERVLRTVGCVDVTDYVDIIVEPHHVDEVYRTLAQLLADHRAEYTRINLCNIQENSPTLATFPDQLRVQGFEVNVVLQEVCPVIQLPQTWDAYLEGLDKKQRHEIRRKMRRAEEEQAVNYRVGADADLDLEIEQFLALMRSSQPEKEKFLENPRNERFFRAVIQSMHARGWLQLSFLRINDRPCAAYCDFDYEGHILVYNSGLDMEASAQLSAGIVLLSYDIQHAIDTGRKVFDFLRGNETYKYRMGAVNTRVFMLKAA